MAVALTPYSDTLLLAAACVMSVKLLEFGSSVLCMTKLSMSPLCQLSEKKFFFYNSAFCCLEHGEIENWIPIDQKVFQSVIASRSQKVAVVELTAHVKGMYVPVPVKATSVRGDVNCLDWSKKDVRLTDLMTFGGSTIATAFKNDVHC